MSSVHMPEDIVVHFWPTGNATVAHPQVDEIPRILPQGPRALEISRDSKSEVGGDSGADQHRNPIQRHRGRAHCSGWMFTRSIPTTWWTINSGLSAGDGRKKKVPLHLGIYCAVMCQQSAPPDPPVPHGAYSAISIAQMPVPVPRSRMRGFS